MPPPAATVPSGARFAPRHPDAAPSAASVSASALQPARGWFLFAIGSLVLAGTRAPEFRPHRADPRRVAHVDFDLRRPPLLTAAAARLRAPTPAPAPPAPARSRVLAGGGAPLVTFLTLVALLGISDAPCRNPAPPEAEFVITFGAYGDWVSGAAAALPDPAPDPRPVHMRAAQPAQHRRAPVVVHLEVDGRREVHVFPPKGFSAGGASVGELRVWLMPGAPCLAGHVATHFEPAAPRQTWSGAVTARPARVPDAGGQPGLSLRALTAPVDATRSA